MRRVGKWQRWNKSLAGHLRRGRTGSGSEWRVEEKVECPRRFNQLQLTVTQACLLGFGLAVGQVCQVMCAPRALSTVSGCCCCWQMRTRFHWREREGKMKPRVRVSQGKERAREEKAIRHQTTRTGDGALGWREQPWRHRAETGRCQATQAVCTESEHGA